MHVKCGSLRFIFIDECECVGAGTCIDLETNLLNGVSTRNTYKHHLEERFKRLVTYRSFGGVNTSMFGDFFQLPPAGGTAVMPNPKSQSSLEHANVQNTLMRFWSCYDDANDVNALQQWQETNCKVMDLQVNHRSGEDVWYSDMLTSCREGNMSMTDWQFLHGLPTEECGSWLTQQEKSMW